MAEKILTTEFSEEMQRSYLNYSMSVITSRAIPDVRDGLKPVQRRVLYAMEELRLNPDKPHRKSARIVGDTMGKYHPHGDSSIYETLVGLAQPFKKGMALVEGHGNFGSIEGDGAAAMRYTEARLQKFTQEVFLKDLDKTVNFVDNYDDSEKEPEVLPARIPNILVNGAEGIAVGMSTSIPTHNLGEVIDAIEAYIDNRDITTEELLQYIPGPDFPTGGILCNKSELPAVYETGTGKLRLRGKTEFEPGAHRGDRDKLVITEIPYTMVGAGINKFLTDVAELVDSRKLPDVVDISDQSGKDGMRIVLELKRGADVEKIKNILYKKTKLEDTYGVNMLAIVDGRPETLNLRGILSSYLDFQYENNTRKYESLLAKEREREEINSGLIRACDQIDLIIAVLRGAKNRKDAKKCLMTGDISAIKFRTAGWEIEALTLNYTEKQADAILDMHLYKLIGLEIQALQKEYEQCLDNIERYEEILSDKKCMDRVIRDDLDKIKEEFSVPRKTVLEDSEEAVVVEEEAPVQEAVFLMDRFGYCKLLEESVYEKNQHAVDSDFPTVIHCETDERICVFTDKGNLHQLRLSDVPFSRLRDKGVPLDNICRYDGSKEEIVFLTKLGNIQGQLLLFATKMGMVKQVPSEEFLTNNRTVSATRLQEGDSLVTVRVVGQETEIVLLSEQDYALRFMIDEIPEMKKNAKGVRGIRLGAGDSLKAVFFVSQEPVTELKGKEVHLNKLRMAKRDGKGVKIRF